jgi:hypothetical protein
MLSTVRVPFCEERGAWERFMLKTTFADALRNARSHCGIVASKNYVFHWLNINEKSN